MAPWNWKRNKPRRVDRLRPEGEKAWHERLKGRLALQQMGVLVVFFIATLLIVQAPRQVLPVRVGEAAAHPITARTDFSYVDAEATTNARDLAAALVSGVYRHTKQPVQALRESLLGLVEAGWRAETPEALPQAVREAWTATPDLLAAVKRSVGPEGERLPDAQAAVQLAMDALAEPLNLPILTDEARQNESDRGKDTRDIFAKLPAGLVPEGLRPLQGHEVTITIEGAEGDREVLLRSVLTTSQTGLIRDRVASLTLPLGGVFGEDQVRSLAATMAVKLGPTLVYDQAKTENRRAAARETIEAVRVPWKTGATLLKAGTTVTERHIELLRTESEAYRASLGLLRRTLSWAGSALFLGLVTVVTALYVYRFQPRVARSTPRSLMLIALCLLVLGAAKGVAHTEGAYALSVFGLTAAALIVAFAYTAPFALVLGATLAVLVAVATRADLAWLLTALAGMTTAVLALGRINTRSKLIKVGALAGLAFFAASIGLALARLKYAPETVGAAVWASAWYFVAGLASGFLMLGVLPFIERAFGIVTNISLLELSDVNQPALRRLALEAPGTYQHSLLIGTLAEAAAEAIGANGLLARVGAYYHDIGKVSKPKYYVENWQKQEETHEGLRPQMSRLVITSHVKDGQEMADRLGLPPVIKAFIAEHHGTTLVEYFYSQAKRAHAEEGGEPPKEEDYRYPGPKPQSPETAIVMLADGSEGMTRSLKEPTAAKIRGAVHELTMKRLLDGQLDESGLTMSDLRKVEETLTKTLVSVYHGRVPYPSDEARTDGETSPKPRGGPGDGRGATEETGGEPEARPDPADAATG